MTPHALALLLALPCGPTTTTTPAATARVVKAVDAPTHLIGGGKGSATLLLTTAKEASMTLLVLAAGGTVPEHTHDGSAEILYIESGTVEMTLDGKPVSAGPGDVVYIPAGIKHSARVTSRFDPLRAVQVYAAPGPEQRFTKGERISR